MSDLHKPVDQELLAWAGTLGGSAFCAAVRQRLIRGGKLDKWLRLDVNDPKLSDIHALFGHDSRVVRSGAVHLGRADLALRRTRFGVGIRSLVIAVGGPIISRRGSKRHRDMLNRYRVAHQRYELWKVMSAVPQLDRERELLEQLELGTTSQVPPASATVTRSWSTYESAIRAAAWWYPEWSLPRVPWEREVAANALNGSKKWTMAQLDAFSRLVGVGIKDALQWTDALIRVAGPLTWTNMTPIADAHLSRPWIDIPAQGVLESGELHCRAAGVLLVENQTTFEHLRRDTALTQTWLCVWLEGNASKGLVPFLRRISPRHVAAWCDLDPDGIEIIQAVETELGQSVVPVGMTPEIWRAGAKLVERTPEAYLTWKRAAAHLVENGPAALRPLAAAIATTGERCEQESIQFGTTPEVVNRLQQLAKESETHIIGSRS